MQKSVSLKEEKEDSICNSEFNPNDQTTDYNPNKISSNFNQD